MTGAGVGLEQQRLAGTVLVTLPGVLQSSLPVTRARAWTIAACRTRDYEFSLRRLASCRVSTAITPRFRHSLKMALMSSLSAG